MSESDFKLFLNNIKIESTVGKDKRDKVSLKDKSRLVKAYDDGEDYMDLGEKMGIKRNTVQSIIRLWRKCGLLSKGKQGGYKKPVITDEIGKKLVDLVESRPLCPLKDMKTFLATFEIFPTEQTISNYLHGKCISICETPQLIEGLNIDEVKQKRHDYVQNLIENDITSNECIYVDEFVFNFWMKRAYGRTQKVERIYRHCCGQKGTNVTLMIAISQNGVKHYKIFTNNVTDTDFGEFLMDLSAILGRNNRFFIINNKTSPHSVTISSCEKHNLVFLPPLSNFLNPLNQIFKKLKLHLMQAMPNQNEVVKMGLLSRKELLQKKLFYVMDNFFTGSFEEYYEETESYYVNCLNKNDIYYEY